MINNLCLVLGKGAKAAPQEERLLTGDLRKYTPAKLHVGNQSQFLQI